MRGALPLDAFRTIPDAARPPIRPVVLSGRWLLAARLAFAGFAALALWLEVTNLVHAVQSAGGLWLAAIGDATRARAALASGGVRLAAFLVIGGLGLLRLATFFGAAVLLVWRSREAIAFLVALFLVSAAAADFPPNLFALMPAEPVRAVLGLTVTYCFPLTLGLIFYVFPDGRFTPRWTILPAIWWAGSLAWTFFVDRSQGSFQWGALLTPGLLLVSVVAAQTYRHRRVSGPVERLQMRWFLSGLGPVLVTFIGGILLLSANGAFERAALARGAAAWGNFEVAFGLASLFLPVALAVAVLRYRLFDLDLVINRALVYGGLTAGVVGTYILVVGYLGTLFRTGGNLVISLVATGVVAVLFQPLRERLQRGANRLLYGQRDEPYAVVARLGRQLEASLSPDAVLPTIVETVAATLKLPYVAIALRDERATTVAAAHGSEGSHVSEVVPLIYQGEQVGELRLAPRPGEPSLAAADRRLADDLARHAGIAVHAVQLTRDLRRARARLVIGREEERRRLRRDLHDGLGPALASQALTIDAAELLLERDPQGAASLLREVKAQSHAAVGEIRRLVHGLRPPALDDLGLLGALRDVANHYTGTGLEVAVAAAEHLPPLPAAVEVAAFRIVQEALTNVARHARARRCTITLAVDADLTLTVTDDGAGIPADRRAGVGLASMRERAEELGGACSVTPGPGGGTVVTARLPLQR